MDNETFKKSMKSATKSTIKDDSHGEIISAHTYVVRRSGLTTIHAISPDMSIVQKFMNELFDSMSGHIRNSTSEMLELIGDTRQEPGESRYKAEKRIKRVVAQNLIEKLMKDLGKQGTSS